MLKTVYEESDKSDSQDSDYYDEYADESSESSFDQPDSIPANVDGEEFDSDSDDNGTIAESLINSDLDDLDMESISEGTSLRRNTPSANSFWTDVICWATSRPVPSIEGGTLLAAVNNDATLLNEENNPAKESKSENLLGEQELVRARIVFDHCANEHGRINEEQFNLSLSLLGQIEKGERIREIFLKESSEWINFSTFTKLLHELRTRSEIGELSSNINEAFDALVCNLFIILLLILTFFLNVVRRNLLR